MAAFFIDMFLVYGVVLLIANLTGRTVGYGPLGFRFGPLGTLLVLLGALVYFVATEAGFGATVGKRAAGLRVRREDGGPMGFGQSVVRNLLRLIDALAFVVPFLVGAIFIWNSAQAQRIGDRAGRTVVVALHTDQTFQPRTS